DDSSNTGHSFRGPVTIISFGKAQYQWHPARKNGYADPDGPPVTSTQTGGPDALCTLPAASVNILRGNIDTARQRSEERRVGKERRTEVRWGHAGRRVQ